MRKVRDSRLTALLQILRRKNVVMGVVNVTPDSFSDGGLYLDPDRAAEHALELVRQGADLLDIGGESTRPGAERISPDVQIERILPVIEKVREMNEDLPISVDTTQSDVAKAALSVGADIINDISALRESPSLAEIVAGESGAMILMHMRGTPATMQMDTDYEDLIGETKRFLGEQANRAESTGLLPERVWLDPGIGFGKSIAGNLEILRYLSHYDELGHPIVVGVSRKSFIGGILSRPPMERLAGTLAVTAYLAVRGTYRIHRVHDVREVRDCLRMVEALQGGMR